MKPVTLERLIEITGRVMPSAQARELDHLGYPYERRRDGSILLYEEAVARRVLTPSVAGATFSVPDFGAINRRRE